MLPVLAAGLLVVLAHAVHMRTGAHQITRIPVTATGGGYDISLYDSGLYG